MNNSKPGKDSRDKKGDEIPVHFPLVEPRERMSIWESSMDFFVVSSITTFSTAVVEAISLP